MTAIFPKAFSHKCFYFQATRSHPGIDGAYVGYIKLDNTEPIGLQSVEYRKRYCDQAFWIAIGF